MPSPDGQCGYVGLQHTENQKRRPQSGIKSLNFLSLVRWCQSIQVG